MTVKLRILSDLHLEFYNHKIPMSYNGRDMEERYFLSKTDDEADQHLLLAGDIMTVKTSFYWKHLIEDWSKRFKSVTVIAGNHEFYHSEYHQTLNYFADFYGSCGENVKFLHDNATLLPDSNYIIFGTTFWTNFNKGNLAEMMIAQRSMADYSCIKMAERRLIPEDTIRFHEYSYRFLDTFLKQFPHNVSSEHKAIVMTHHAPSFQSTHPKYKNSSLNSAFSSDKDHMIIAYQPKLWIHGHHHSSVDYMIDNTRVVCNPLGYWKENDKHFKKDLIINL